MSEASELRLEVVNDDGQPVLVVVRVTEIVRVPLSGDAMSGLLADFQRALSAATCPPRLTRHYKGA